MMRIINDCDNLLSNFLKNILNQIKTDQQLCMAVPAWFGGKSFRHLPTLDHLEKIGYNRISFIHATNEELIYHRPGQIVARELVVLTKR